MPFGSYKNFDDCVKRNKGKDNPKAYCAKIQSAVEEAFAALTRFKETGERTELTSIVESVNFVLNPDLDSESVEKVSKDFPLVNYRDMRKESYATCANCTFFLQDGSCKVIAGDIETDYLCNLFSPDADDGAYLVVDWEKYLNGLIVEQPLTLTVEGAIETTEGTRLVLSDGLDNYFSVSPEMFVEKTASWLGWTDNDVQEKITNKASKPTSSTSED